MNLYILVEGKHTEMQVYPLWFSILKPEYKKVDSLKCMSNNTYYIISGLGNPSIYAHIKESMKKICVHNQNNDNKIDQFVICMDADYDGSVSKTNEKIHSSIVEGVLENGLDFDVPFVSIIQNKCFETWFLGNASMYPLNITDDFRHYHDFYNVGIDDPELMDKPSDNIMSIGGYHKAYLKKMLSLSGLRYKESNAKSVCAPEYIAQLKLRVMQTNHLSSLKCFFEYIASLY